MTKAETIFQKELNLIHDKDIKQFVITCFDKLCPNYFWTCPCSTTGKYHPQVSLGVGGLIRHTKLVVWWGLHLATALGNSPELREIPQNQLLDEIIATLLLHDMIKNGKGLNAQGRPFEKGVTGTHGVTLANRICDEILDQKLNNSYIRILGGIALHMGIWTTKVYHTIDGPGVNVFIELIHLADYCASRKVDKIYRELNCQLQGERNDLIKNTTEVDEGQTPAKSPPCPGVHPTESHQTTTAESK